MSNDKLVDMLSAPEMASVAERVAIYKINTKPFTTLCSAIIAGLFVGIAFAFYTGVTVGSNDVPYGLAKFVGGICFSMGLMLILVCSVDLFTSTILTSIPKATGKISWFAMFRNWGIVYFGNFIGALFLVFLLWYASQYMAAKGQWGANVLNIATSKMKYSFVEALFLGVLANLMVCLAVWMSYAGRSLTDKLLIMILPVAMFVTCGFEHSIANMFLIPMGIAISWWGPTEFWTQINQSPDAYRDLLTGANFLKSNLIPVTLGNIIGGLMVGLSFCFLHLHKKSQ